MKTRTLLSRHRAAGRALLVLAVAAVAGLCASPAWAQQASVQGIVTDRASARPLPGADVVLERGGRVVRSIQTDRNGLFQFAGLEAGSYRLHIVSPGYTSLDETLELKAGESLTANRGLAPDPLQLEGIQVQNQGPGAVRRDLGGQTVTARDLARVPTPAASGDLATYLQTVPGVVSTGDRGGQLFIRGGTPSDNLVLMDGMLVYQPYHITGFFSVFPEDLVDRAEFFPGGFGPRYSGRISSVLDVQMRDGSRDRRSVSASVSPFLADVVAEGPFGPSGARDSYIVSVRRSLIEETSPWLLGQKQPLGFDSEYFKYSSVGRDGGSRCSLTAMRTSDRGGLDPQDEQSRVGWRNYLLGGRCSSLAGSIFVDARVAYSRISSEAITRGASDFSSTAGRFAMEGDASRTVGRVRLNFGGFAHSEAMSYDFLEFRSQNDDNTSWIGAGLYGEAEVPLGGGLRVLPGAVVSWYPQAFSPALEPRLRALWRPSRLVDGELSGAVGLYDQRVAGISDRRDASSIFTAWMASPDSTRMEALHAQLSWQQSVGAGFSYSVDGFYRRMRNLPVSTWTTVATFTPELSLADGRTRGGDARIEYRRGPFYVFGGYGYSWTEYESAQADFGVWFGQPVVRFNPPHDRRHQADGLASLDLGRYTLSAHWEYGSGLPFTRPLGFDEVFDFRTQLPNVLGSYGQTRLLLDRPYNGRMPPTHRLDVSVKRVGHLWSRPFQLQAGVINAYDQTNIFYYDVFANRRVDQLPFAPYVSVSIRPEGGSGR